MGLQLPRLLFLLYITFNILFSSHIVALQNEGFVKILGVRPASYHASIFKEEWGPFSSNL